MRRLPIRFLFCSLLVLCCSSQDFEICEDGIVQVTGLEVFCDGSTCNYGEYLNVSVHFDVLATESENDIYMKLAVYTPEYYDKLYEGNPKVMCSQYDADNGGCVNEGSFSFFLNDIPLATLDGDEVYFTPLVQLAFSVEANGGSDLGGVNIGDCDIDDDDDMEDDEVEEESSSWTNAFSGSQAQRILHLFGVVLIVAVAACISAYVLFKAAVYAQCCNPVELHDSDDKEYSLMRSKASYIPSMPFRYSEEKPPRDVV